MREEIEGRIEKNDKFYLENLNSIETAVKNDKSDVKKDILETSEKFEKMLEQQLEQMRSDVNKTTKDAEDHREKLQGKYDEKLRQIKDVCAQYFSKYEKHLLHQAEMVKALE